MPWSKARTAPSYGNISATERSPPHMLKDRKSTRLNSSHITTSYAVFCLKKKTLKLDAGAVDPHVGLGYVLLRRGSSTEAEDQFRFALRREASNLDAQKGIGLALRDQKK